PTECHHSVLTSLRPPTSTPCPYTTLFRSLDVGASQPADEAGPIDRLGARDRGRAGQLARPARRALDQRGHAGPELEAAVVERPVGWESTSPNSSHGKTSYSVICLKKKSRH